MEMLSHEMYARGLRSKFGGRIHKSKIDRVLNNPFYMGVIKIVTTGYTVPGIHEPLISTGLFEQAQRAKLKKSNKKKTKHMFLYR